MPIGLKDWLWEYRFRRIRSEIANSPVHPERLRFVFGLARSGTSWAARVLASTTYPIRYYKEPIPYLNLHLSKAKQSGYTCIGYRKDISVSSRLVKAYTYMTADQIYWPELAKYEGMLGRLDKDWRLCLVKEVHALLAIEGLLKTLNCPAVILIRNPLYIVDSLIDAQGFETGYLVHEPKLLSSQSFIDGVVPNKKKEVASIFMNIASQKNGRLKIVASKVVCAALIQTMFQKVGEKLVNVHLISYEELCNDAENTLKKAAELLSIEWDISMEGFLKSTMKSNATENDSYSVHRNTESQPKRKFKVLEKNEIEYCKHLLEFLKD